MNQDIQADADAVDEAGEGTAQNPLPIISPDVPLRADGRVPTDVEGGNTVQPGISDAQAEEYEREGAQTRFPINPARLPLVPSTEMPEGAETEGKPKARGEITREGALAYLALTALNAPPETVVVDGDSWARATRDGDSVRVSYVRGKTRYDMARIERDAAEDRKTQVLAQRTFHEQTIESVEAQLKAFPDEIAAKRSDENAFEIAKLSGGQRITRAQNEIARIDAEANATTASVQDAPEPQTGELRLTFPTATLVLI